MREKLIKLLDDFSAPVMLLDTKLIDWNIPTQQLREAIADYLIANGVTVLDCKKDCTTCWKTKLVTQRWIPVTERLPEVSDRYLCNIKSFAFPGTFYQRILPYDKYGFKEDHIYTDDVTHWMPIPEEPKVGRKETEK